MAEVLILKSRKGQVDLKVLYRELARRGVLHILAEGGGEVMGSLIDQKLADEAYFFIAPKIIGGKNAVASVAGEGFRYLKDAVPLKNLQVKKVGADYLFHGYF